LEEGRCRRINARFNRLEEAYRQLALEQERSSSSNEFLNSVFTAPLENTSDVGSGDEHVPEADEVDDQQWTENLGTAASNLLSPKVSFADKAPQHENTSDVCSGAEDILEADEVDDQQWTENLGTEASNLLSPKVSSTDEALQRVNFCMVSGAMHFVRNMVSASVSEISNIEMAISTCEDNEGVAAGSIDFFFPSFCGAPCPDLSTDVTVGGIDSLKPVSFLKNISKCLLLLMRSCLIPAIISWRDFTSLAIL
jgi:hypothetical protein